ncbi:Uncharacterised protein [Sphingobacterium spiritivorum]|uniref:Outer membrane protein beta-barrel domain-containing protein n=1 Tax=Sphingobacterium spiritivorum TaxID=258 RepID=A0A380CU11_SPHSI|nr:hypothetical protein [Sphingobacterium spiritivorum]SUJ29023.1 Uncharacterised protein [Sphingobacterium spiritivorum]
MSRLYIILFLSLFSYIHSAGAQIINIGYKYEEKSMFQTTINIPFVMDKNKPYEYMAGLDYSTKNALAPSGIAPQLTGGYYIIDDKRKSNILSLQLSAGYLFDLNKNFQNQVRLSPHVYFELNGIFNFKAGYDFLMPLEKGYPYVSIGLGGLLSLRHMSIGF